MHLQQHGALLGELDGVVEHVEQDLLQALRVTQHDAGDAVGDVVRDLSNLATQPASTTVRGSTMLHEHSLFAEH